MSRTVGSGHIAQRHSVRLLTRTTRSVAPTDAGAELIAHLGPALADIRGALEKLTGLRDTPAGRVRIVASRLAAKTILAPQLGVFARQYPDIVLDITTDDGRIDLVAGGYGAGIQFGDTSRRTWSRYVYRQTIGRRLSDRVRISNRIRSPSRRAISFAIAASTSGTDRRACIGGSSTRGNSR